MQTTEQGDGRFFHAGASSVYQYTDTEPACLVWEHPSPSAKTPQASLCLWRRGLLLEQSSPQTGLPTPKGAPQLRSCLICYEPLSIIRVLECTTKTSNSPLWGELLVFLTSWGGLPISRKVIPTEMLPPNPGVLIPNWRLLLPRLDLMCTDYTWRNAAEPLDSISYFCLRRLDMTGE